MKYQIIERPKVWTIFVEADEMKYICKIADMLDSLFGDVSSIQYNRLAKQGIILLDKSASSSKEALRKVIDELIT